MSDRLRTLKTRVWVGVNYMARNLYRGVQRRSPALAARMRDGLLPALMAANRRILQRDYVMLGAGLRGRSRDRADFSAYQAGPSAPGFRPLVSILVPNYNHAPYLRRRLESIYAQGYDNYEVLLMDDCSSDESRAILEEFAALHPARTRLLFNETNSGGVFFQWEKGLRAARGDLVWVAESDDWASENFLETLVPFFANPAVQLAYAPTVFMNGAGTEPIWSMDHYLADLGPKRWHAPFVLPAPQAVREGFALKNLIPNVSSAVFRRMDRLDVLDIARWRGMRTCGDWVFYLNVLRGGLLAYSPAATNYYRIHQSNTSVASYSEDRFYREHETVAATVAALYGLDPETLEAQKRNLIEHWTRNRGGFDAAAFAQCYDPARILAAAGPRKPNLLMVGFAFCAGGGETFPIQLANLMKAAGHSVTFLNCGQEPEVPGIRAMLARDIPVVSDFGDLNGIVEDFEIDVIHSHHAWVDNTIIDLLEDGSRARTVVTLHGMYETIPEASLRRLLPRLVARTGKLVYTAEKNLGALLAHGLVRPGEIERIDNALAPAAATPIERAALGLPQDAFVLTLVSRAREDKGWQEAIDAIARARAIGGRDIRLVLIGEGDAHARLTAKGAPDFVRLEGFRENIRDYFAASDMGFLPSRFRGESFPLVVIDCLNTGRPVLASDAGEIPYMLATPEGPAGEVFALKDWTIDVEDLARRIARLAGDPAEVARLAARVPLAMHRFDPQVMAARYGAAYAALGAKEEGVRDAAA